MNSNVSGVSHFVNHYQPFERAGELRVITVSDETLDMLDPTGYLSARARKLDGRAHSGPPFSIFQRKDILTLYNEYKMYRDKSDPKGRYSALYEYEDEMWVDKVAPQGGKNLKAEIRSKFLRYYDYPRKELNVHPDLLAARDVAKAMLLAVKTRCPLPEVKFEARPGPEAAGAPFYGRKSDDKELEFARAAWAPNPMLFPSVGGWREQRNGTRSIFMESFYGVTALSPYLTQIRDWAAENMPHFASWRNPNRGVNLQIEHGLQLGFTWFEGDYDAMDTTLTLPVLEELVFPLWEVLWEPEVYERNVAYIRRLYNAPLILGNEIFTGTHSTFSGQVITNDVETWLSFVVQLAMSQCFKSSKPMVMLMLGDDLLLGGSPATSTTKMAELFELYCASLHMRVKVEKLRFSKEPRYLRRTYSLAGRRPEGIFLGAYPLTFTMNSLFNPEHGCGGSQAVVSALQICDNAQGHPHWEWFITRLWNQFTHLDGEGGHPNRRRRMDWWERLYGEVWNPQSSATAIHLLASNYKHSKQLLAILKQEYDDCDLNSF